MFLSTSSWSLVFSCWISTRTKFRLRCSFTICQLVNLNVDTVLNCFFGQISSNNSPHLKNLMFRYSPRFSHFLSFTTHRENRICMARLIDVTWPYKKRASRKKERAWVTFRQEILITCNKRYHLITGMPVIKKFCPQEKQKCIVGAKRAQQGFKQMCAFPFEVKYFEYPNWVRSLPHLLQAIYLSFHIIFKK